MDMHIKKHTQEEANRIAEEEEKAAERQERRRRYYGNDGHYTQYKRRPHIFLFRAEDLDNDDVISAVESTPTYKRTREVLDSIRSRAKGDDPIKEETFNDKNEYNNGTIKFVN
jgi:cell division protein FtsZ